MAYRRNRKGSGENMERRWLRAAWHTMQARAGNADGNHPTYLGVRIDQRWVTFDGFLAHQPDGRQYEQGLCLTRIGDSGDYSPENCRWAPKANNAREMHERRTMHHMSDGRFALDVARENGISDTLFGTRVADRGWDVDEAATRPPRTYRKRDNCVPLR